MPWWANGKVACFKHKSNEGSIPSQGTKLLNMKTFKKFLTFMCYTLALSLIFYCIYLYVVK